MNQQFLTIQNHFQNSWNWAINFLNQLPNIINKLKVFCIYIITLVKQHFNNLLEIKNISFNLLNIGSSLGIIGNAIIALLFFVVILIVICFLTSILDMIKRILKMIKFIVWNIPKTIFKTIIIVIIKFFKFLLFYKKNRTPEKKIEEKIIVNNETPKEINILQNDLFNLNETIRKQNILLEKIVSLNVKLNQLEKRTTKSKKTTKRR
ncbi:MAG: hypothetical protein U9532_04115 (plasmid) ['Conium maculatum' witches'-broom phytoplasma]|nr:hypothetical protein ['Conium maculatum' witches'-broom phytoplasma]